MFLLHLTSFDRMWETLGKCESAIMINTFFYIRFNIFKNGKKPNSKVSTVLGHTAK